MANDEERLVASNQTNRNLDVNPEDPTKTNWKGHLKLPVPSEATDTLLYFDIYNQTSDEVVSSGQLDFEEMKLFQNINDKGVAEKAMKFDVNIADSDDTGQLVIQFKYTQNQKAV